MRKAKNQLQMVLLALLVGAITGVLGTVFNTLVRKLIEVLMLYHPLAFKTRMLIIPITGGLALGLIHKYYIKGDLYGFDVTGVMEEIRSINTYLMKPVMALVKTASTILTLAIGWSVGRHGPIVYIGGAVGSWLGYTYHFKRENIKILIACGVAGALAGVFNEPVFAILFVLEVILHKGALAYFTPVTVSAIASATVLHLLGGNAPFIDMRATFEFGARAEFIWVVVTGVLMGGLAVLYIRSIKFMKHQLIRLDMPVLKGLSVGCLIALMGLLLPEIFDLHLNTIRLIVSDQLGVRVLILLVVFKIFLTALSLGSVGVGGVFSPGLTIGAAAGYLTGVLFQGLPVVQVGGVNTYALFGMAAFFAGFANAPLSATLLAVELTGESGLILPLLIACVAASITTEAIQKDSIYGHTNLVKIKE
jgi:CIC family chloride channel protein